MKQLRKEAAKYANKSTPEGVAHESYRSVPRRPRQEKRPMETELRPGAEMVWLRRRGNQLVDSIRVRVHHVSQRRIAVTVLEAGWNHHERYYVMEKNLSAPAEKDNSDD
jgi:hypothetical protein